MTKMWDGRFTTSTNHLMEQFNSSIHIDKRLVFHDIEGSMAHVKMLHKIGLLEDEEQTQLISGLEEVRQEFWRISIL